MNHFGLLNPKTFDSYFLDMMYVEFTKNLLLTDSSEMMAWTHFGLLGPKTFDYYYMGMMYIEFMKNFLLADSCGLMAVKVISAN